MFHGIIGNLIRIILVIAFGLVTFWSTDYGLFFIGIRELPINPLLVSVCAAIWSLIFFLILPLTLRWFQRLSTLCLLVIFGVLVLVLDQHGANLTDKSFWLTWGIGALFSLIAWYIVSVPLWRSIHGGISTVQQVGPIEEEHHSH
jgi:hypothetical protein